MFRRMYLIHNSNFEFTISAQEGFDHLIEEDADGVEGALVDGVTQEELDG